MAKAKKAVKRIPRKAAKKKAVKRAYRRRQELEQREPELQTLTLETNIPITGKSDSVEMIVIKDAIRDIANNMKVGNSFVIRLGTRTSIRKMLRAEYPEKAFRGSPVPGKEKEFIRFWRIK